MQDGLEPLQRLGVRKYQFAQARPVELAVRGQQLLIERLQNGVKTRRTGLHGAPRELVRADHRHARSPPDLRDRRLARCNVPGQRDTQHVSCEARVDEVQ